MFLKSSECSFYAPHLYREIFLSNSYSMVVRDYKNIYLATNGKGSTFSNLKKSKLVNEVKKKQLVCRGYTLQLHGGMVSLITMKAYQLWLFVLKAVM